MTKSSKSVRGTGEWAVATVDCCIGCPNDCKYCYARYSLVERKRLVSPDDWLVCHLKEDELVRRHPLYPGQVMFPANHDIVPENLDGCIRVIRHLLAVGNRVLLVSKPHLSCMKKLCSEFSDYKEQILFRFTITARKSEILRCWEPQAPLYTERKSCLQYVYENGFSSSVSVEPMLDIDDVAVMVHDLMPYVTHSIWLGKLNKIKERVICDTDEMRSEIARILKGQTDTNINKLYGELKDLKKIRWKESIKEVVGLELVGEPGLDL